MHRPNSLVGKILVCTPSNAASDLVAERLAGELESPHDMLRVIAMNRLHRDVPEAIRVFTTPEGALNEGHRMPSEEQLKQAMIVVVTLGTAGRLFGCYPDLTACFLVVDEAAQSTEIDICTALTFCRPGTTRRIVLAGDPKQLGPTIQSNAAKLFKLGNFPNESGS